MQRRAIHSSLVGYQVIVEGSIIVNNNYYSSLTNWFADQGGSPGAISNKHLAGIDGDENPVESVALKLQAQELAAQTPQAFGLGARISLSLFSEFAKFVSASWLKIIVLSGLALVPCFWHREIAAGDREATCTTRGSRN